MGGVEMRRRDFLIGAGALTLTAAGGPLLFRRGRAFAGSTPVEGMIPFNDCDTLENIRAIIKHNNFRFEVDHNWLYDHYGFASTQADASPRVVPQIIIPSAAVPPDPDLPPKFDHATSTAAATSARSATRRRPGSVNNLGPPLLPRPLITAITVSTMTIA